MGIDELEQSWWDRKVRQPFREKHPVISEWGDYISEGILDVAKTKIPNFIEAHRVENPPGSDFPYSSTIIPEIAKWGGNLATEGARYGTDAVLAATMEVPHLPFQLYNWNAKMGNALTDWTGIESLHTDILPGHGWGGTGTKFKDVGQDLFDLEGSGMREEAESQVDKYGGWYYDDKFKNEDNPAGVGYHLNLDNWDIYQSWKDGSGKDFNAMDREVKKQTTKDIDEWIKNEGSLDQLNNDFLKHVWAPLSEEDKRKYDYNESFKGYYNSRLAQEKGWYDNYNEFSRTGQDYANWASDKYRGDFISKYGRYPLEDFWGQERMGAPDMKFDVSPFAEITADFNLANKDYVDAIAEGRASHGIGAPKEFDYGIFDKEKGVGISEFSWKEPWNFSYEEPFEYGSEEAKTLAHSGPVTAAEFLLAGKGAGKFFSNPGVNKLLHGTKTGRVLRETFPGMLHYGSRANFGFPKFKKVRTDPAWKKLGKGSVNVLTTAVDWARPKGFQMGIGIAGGERKNRQWQE